MVGDKIADIEERSSFEDHDDYLVFVLKMIKLANSQSDVETEHLVIILIEDKIFTFQENRDDLSDPILAKNAGA